MPTFTLPDVSILWRSSLLKCTGHRECLWMTVHPEQRTKRNGLEIHFHFPLFTEDSMLMPLSCGQMAWWQAVGIHMGKTESHYTLTRRSQWKQSQPRPANQIQESWLRGGGRVCCRDIFMQSENDDDGYCFHYLLFPLFLEELSKPMQFKN